MPLARRSVPERLRVDLHHVHDVERLRGVDGLRERLEVTIRGARRFAKLC
jgi:hypothetical protein